MKRFIFLTLLLGIVSCSKTEIGSDDFVFDLPNPINRELHLVEDAWASPIQKYTSFDEPFYSQLQFNYSTNQTNVWSDIVKMNFDGSYTSLNVTNRVFESAQDSLNGLLFDINKNKLLVNFWGEGEYGSWYYPNVVVVFDLDSENYEILYDGRGTNESTFYSSYLFDLNNDGELDVFLGGNGYIINETNPTITPTPTTGPGPSFVFDIDTDGVDDLIHFDTSNNQWIRYKGGTNIQKEFITSNYSFRNYVDDYVSFDYDSDGDLDLLIMDALTDGTNDGCEVCIGKISILQNTNGNLLDVTETIFSDSEFPQYFGDNNIVVYDYDSDGDLDIFFPDYYYHADDLFNNYYWENDNGNFNKKVLNNLDI